MEHTATAGATPLFACPLVAADLALSLLPRVVTDGTHGHLQVLQNLFVPDGGFLCCSAACHWYHLLDLGLDLNSAPTLPISYQIMTSEGLAHY